MLGTKRRTLELDLFCDGTHVKILSKIIPTTFNPSNGFHYLPIGMKTMKYRNLQM